MRRMTVEDRQHELDRRLEEDRRAYATAATGELTQQQVSEFIARRVQQARNDAPLAADLLAAQLRIAGRHDLAELADRILAELRVE